MTIRKSGSGVVSRRLVLQGSAALIGTLAAPAIIRPAQAAEKLLVGSNGGDYMKMQKAAYCDPFTAQTGIPTELISGSYMNAANIKAMVATGNYPWSVGAISSSDAAICIDNGWLEPIDYSLIDKSDKVESQFRKFAVTGEAVGSAFAYRADRMKEGPSSFSDFYDVQKFPGKRAMWKSGRTVVESALLADGVPLDKLYPYDFDRAFKKANELKRIITTWWETGAQSQDVIVSGNVDICYLWSGRGIPLIREGRPIALNYGPHAYELSNLVVPKGAPNKQAAMRLISVASGAKALATTANMVGYGPSNPKANELIDPAVLPLLNTSPGNIEKVREEDWVYAAKIKNELNERFLNWFVT
jgi:putative spermidine/putrescine transport system substrate-binding protein